MKKILLILILTSLNCFSQQNFDLLKSLNSEKKADLSLKISLTKTGIIPGGITDEDQKSIKNLELFLKNPFDKNISDFSLSNSLERLDDIVKKVIIAETNEMTKGGTASTGSIKIGKPQFKDAAIEALTELPSIIPTGYSASTQIINALSQFLVDRTKQELTLTFYENFKEKLDTVINLPLQNGGILSIKLKEVFKTTYRLFESNNYFDSPSLGETWIIAFKKDLIELPMAVKEIILKNENLSKTKTGHFAIVSFDAINKIKKGQHPIEIIEELNDTYYKNYSNEYEIDQIIGLLQLLSNNVTRDEEKEDYKEVKWINTNDLKSLDEEQKKYFVGLIYQMGRNNGLFTKPLFENTSIMIENYINENNYNLLYLLIKKTVSNYNIITQQLNSLKQNKQLEEENNELKNYIHFLNTFYSIFDETIESYYSLIKNNQYYQSDYYTKYKPIFNDVTNINSAISDSQYAECLLLTNQLINHIFPQVLADNDIYKRITFYGNFMVDVINTSENKGDLKLVIEKYAMPVSSYRIKRKMSSSWDVNAYPGIYLAYESSGSNSLSYGITAPIGISYSFKNDNKSLTNEKSSSSTLFLSVLDIGAPFSYRFNRDEAEGLPEDIKWEQVFSPGLFYIYGFKKSPLAIGINAQFSPLLRKIEENNVLQTKNIFKIGLTLLVDVPLFNLTNK
jgi:hypothetical protein